MGKKLHIAIVTNNYTPYSGGVVSSINAFTEQLLAQGHRVTIITLDFLGQKHTDPDYVIRIPSLTQFTHYKNYCAVPWRPRANLLEILRKLSPDVVHMQHPFLLCQSALKAARRLSIPVVFTYHTMYERYCHYVPLYQPFVEFAVTKKVLRFCKKVDQIIAPSSAIYDHLIKNGVTTPVEVIPSPLQKNFIFFEGACPTKLDLSGEALAKTEERRRDAASLAQNKKFNLLLVSRLVKEKNVPFVLDVLKQLDAKKYHLKIIGYGQQESFLRAYAYEELQLSRDQVQFIIKPPQEKLVQAYCEADLFLFPSTSDTQGLVLAEAMAGRTPVIAIDGPGQRDIVHNGFNGFIVGSKKEMVQKIKQIADDGNLLISLKNGALQTAQSYSPMALTSRLLQVYKRFC